MKKEELIEIIFSKQRKAIEEMESTKDENGRWRNDTLSTMDFWKNSGKAEAYSEIFQLLMRIDIEE